MIATDVLYFFHIIKLMMMMNSHCIPFSPPARAFLAPYQRKPLRDLSKFPRLGVFSVISNLLKSFLIWRFCCILWFVLSLQSLYRFSPLKVLQSISTPFTVLPFQSFSSCKASHLGLLYSCPVSKEILGEERPADHDISA